METRQQLWLASVLLAVVVPCVAATVEVDTEAMVAAVVLVLVAAVAVINNTYQKLKAIVKLLNSLTRLVLLVTGLLITQKL